MMGGERLMIQDERKAENASTTTFAKQVAKGLAMVCLSAYRIQKLQANRIY